MADDEFSVTSTPGSDPAGSGADLGTIALTGVTGNLGSRVLARMSGTPLVLLGRDAADLARRAAEAGPDVRTAIADYSDGEAVRAGLDGVGTLFFVSGRESADRRHDHRTVVDAATAAGVRRIVYVSFESAAPDATFTFGRDHWYTEQWIRESGLDFTFLRDNWYQSGLPGMVGADRVLRGPAGDGRMAPITHDDIADVAATVLTAARGERSPHDGKTYRLTGPEAFSLAEAATTMSEIAGVPIRFEDETEKEAYASRAHYGAPEFEVEGWVTSYQAVAAGELDVVTDDVASVTGHIPTFFADFLRANPSLLEHVTR